MVEINWNCTIPRYHGEFLHEDDIKKYSCFSELIEGNADDPRSQNTSPIRLAVYDELILRAGYESDLQQRREKDSLEMNRQLQQESTLSLCPAVFAARRQYPRFSSWPKDKQLYVVTKMRQWSVSGMPSNTSNFLEISDFQALLRAMSVEQGEFMVFVRGINDACLAKYNSILPGAGKYIHQCINYLYKRLLEYPPYYAEVKKLSLIAHLMETSPVLVPAGEALDLGCIPFCSIPKMIHPQSVKRFCGNRLWSFHPPNNVYPYNRGQKKCPTDGRYLYKHVVSEDANARRLCESGRVDFVLTPSVLKLLLDNSGAQLARCWEIPVLVEEITVCSGGKPKRVVFLDKPLPPRGVTSPDKTFRLHKRSVRLLVCKQRVGDDKLDYSVWSDKVEKEHWERKLSTQRAKFTHKTVNADEASSVVATEDDSTVSDQNSSLHKNVEPVAEIANADSEDSDDNNLMMDIAADDRCMVDNNVTNTVDDNMNGYRQSEAGTSGIQKTEDAAPLMANRADKREQTTVDASEAAPRMETDSQGSAGVSDDRASSDGFLSPPPGRAINYGVWTLGEYSLLVRTHTHGMRQSPLLGDLVRYTVHPKLAWQAPYGVEVMTPSEIIAQWIDCLVRPSSRVLRVHVDPSTLQVVTTEERLLKQLEGEFVKYQTGFSAALGLRTLENVLKLLSDLTPGRYLLSHSNTDGPQVRLMRSSDAADLPKASIPHWDLRSSFPEQPETIRLTSSPWLPIDTTVLTPYNIKFGRVPGLYNYKPTAEGAGAKVNKNTAGKSMNKKVKKGRAIGNTIESTRNNQFNLSDSKCENNKQGGSALKKKKAKKEKMLLLKKNKAVGD